jgi:hypothetical protein
MLAPELAQHLFWCPVLVEETGDLDGRSSGGRGPGPPGPSPPDPLAPVCVKYERALAWVVRAGWAGSKDATNV